MLSPHSRPFLVPVARSEDGGPQRTARSTSYAYVTNSLPPARLPAESAGNAPADTLEAITAAGDFSYPVWRVGEHFELEVRQRAWWVQRPGVHWASAMRWKLRVLPSTDDSAAGEEAAFYRVRLDRDGATRSTRGSQSGEDAWLELQVRRSDLRPVDAWQHAGSQRRPMRHDFVTEVLSQQPSNPMRAAWAEAREVDLDGRQLRAATVRTRTGRQLWCVDREAAPWFLRHEGATFCARLVGASRWR